MFYILLSALAFLGLYFAIKKLTLHIDEQNLNEPIKAEIYPEFCDFIDEKLRELKEDILKGNLKLINENQKDEFLEKLGDLSRKLTFIQTMNLSKKNDNIWQNELFNFLQNLENLILEFLENGEELSENLRSNLMQKFENLKNSQQSLRRID